MEKINKWPGDNWRYDGLNVHGDHLFLDVAGLVSGHDPEECVVVIKSPYGTAGDVLIGRETWGFTAKWPVGFCESHLKDKLPWVADGMAFKADNPPGNWQWKSPLHMLYQWSRIRTPIVRVWPSRLHDMTEEMAVQEGIEPVPELSVTIKQHGHKDKQAKGWCSPVTAYACLWDSINAKSGHPWSKNEWVWRIEFERIK